jgi:FKBP-type peptidyl-prolyl cis-trans isomerase SlyD
MKIAKDTVVRISYQLRSMPNGPIEDEATSQAPLTFLAGHKNLLDKFEHELMDKVAGDGFEFILTPEEGYGTYNDEQVIDLDINMFVDKDGAIQYEMLAIGGILPLKDNQGNSYRGVIKAIDSEMVKVDLNHSMAGKTLFFSGHVIDVRVASKEEIAHGHVHGEGGHHH